jgi:hypothetical protein
MKAFFLAALIVMALAGTGNSGDKAGPRKAEEQCGQVAKIFFTQSYGGNRHAHGDKDFGTTYKHHYNRNLDKCFMVLTTVITTGEGGTQKDLYELYEHKVYGSFYEIGTKDDEPEACEVSGKLCKSASQWEELLEPFMEE